MAKETQQNQQADLLKVRQSRRETLGQIERGQRSANSKMVAVAAEIAALSELLAKLTPVIFDRTVAAFSSLKGTLKQPVRGRIINAFGTKREGRLTWQGQRFAASASERITAVADGQVIFADWLKGQGLVTIIDHGEGYISLYGNAEVIYAEQGQWIAAGETLGRLSEFQQDATLYFELRKNGRPFNPRNWYQR